MIVLLQSVPSTVPPKRNNEEFDKNGQNYPKLAEHNLVKFIRRYLKIMCNLCGVGDGRVKSQIKGMRHTFIVKQNLQLRNNRIDFRKTLSLI